MNKEYINKLTYFFFFNSFSFSVFYFAYFFFFFFSSRRRHTRCYRDWSSDVCFPLAHLLLRRGGVSGEHLHETGCLRRRRGRQDQAEIFEDRTLLEDEPAPFLEIALHRTKRSECPERRRADTKLLVRPRENPCAEFDSLVDRHRPVESGAHEEVQRLALRATVARALRVLDRTPECRLGRSDLPPSPRRPGEQLPRLRETSVIAS